jgi:putative MATE family efflux protein
MSLASPSRKDLWRQIWTLAWPIAGSNFLLRGAAIVDTAFVGRLGAVALAGLGIAQIPVFLCMAVERGLGVGGQVLIAYHTGANEPERRLKVARAVVALSSVIAVGVAILTWFLTPAICQLMGADAEMALQATEYLKVFYLVFIFSGWFFVFSAIFQGAGDTKTPLYVTGGVNVLHIVMAYVLVFGKMGLPAMGISGTAWAMGASELIGTVILAVIAIRRRLWVPGVRGLSWGATRGD